jgi:DNA (cytosine-5)-methyltransferase 1
MNKEIKVIELFAGVGGFRIGLEGFNKKSATSFYKDDIETPYTVVWSNQWEPSTKTQHASMVYEAKFGKENHSNQDITLVQTEDIPDSDVLVGGFPCQDYSVASTLKNSKGLIGKKGVLWWSIHKILSEKLNKPKYLILENVDRVLISPSKQRGRDFAIILQSLNELGYAVEWRVINASDYGMPQRRKRLFILAYHNTTEVYQSLQKIGAFNWIFSDGVLTDAFPIKENNSLFIEEYILDEDIVEISNNFNISQNKKIFENCGVMINGKISTTSVESNYNGFYTLLKDILQNEIDEEFHISQKDIQRWEYLKGSKKELRKTSEGFEYFYTEGSMAFPDSIEKPSRTIITGEGGSSPSRFKHIIKTDKGYRRLTPIELERLNMFPDDHTKLEGVSNVKRAFFMGNALVIGIIEKIGKSLQHKLYHKDNNG